MSKIEDLKAKLTKLMLVSFWFTFVKCNFNNINQHNFITLMLSSIFKALQRFLSVLDDKINK